ncbi:hypothetical protein DP57_6068 [Burkholderia pseudomallei]|uniref:hypothetical protein n=1 Tax=Burkholderia pseudomallei TaxID=28450 RepID=UPI0005100CD1|nr:hypothetical protein [Burkholderia pseudomallei]KGC70067.1 hypothetical protein DP57_6068 [Burkholderia pseudomallei]
MKGILTGGKVPYSVLCLLSFAVYSIGYRAGHETAKPAPRVAIAEKGAVVLEAALNHPTSTPAQLKALIADPIAAVLRRYDTQGFVVIDTSRNDQGDMTVATLPAQTLDITNELRAAVHLPQQTAVAANSASSVQAASGDPTGSQQ